MPRYGLLIDYNYCTGCHTCELACQQELRLDPQVLGIEIHQQGPTAIAPKKYQYDFFPVPTDLCNHCVERVNKGKKPACVQHCQAGCMYFGTVKELAELMTNEHMVLFTVK